MATRSRRPPRAAPAPAGRAGTPFPAPFFGSSPRVPSTGSPLSSPSLPGELCPAAGQGQPLHRVSLQAAGSIPRSDRTGARSLPVGLWGSYGQGPAPRGCRVSLPGKFTAQTPQNVRGPSRVCRARLQGVGAGGRGGRRQRRAGARWKPPGGPFRLALSILRPLS